MRLNDNSTRQETCRASSDKRTFGEHHHFGIILARVHFVSHLDAGCSCISRVVFATVSSCNLCAWKVISQIPSENSPVGAMQQASPTGMVRDGTIRNRNSSLSVGDGQGGRCAVGPQPYVCRSSWLLYHCNDTTRSPPPFCPLPWPPK